MQNKNFCIPNANALRASALGNVNAKCENLTFQPQSALHQGNTKSKYCKFFCNTATSAILKIELHYSTILKPKTIFYSVWLTSLTLFTHPLSFLFSLYLPFLCLLAWWLCCHGWWISRSTTTRSMVVFLWVFLGGCWLVLWWVCLVLARFFSLVLWWVFLVPWLGFFDRCWWFCWVDGFVGLMGLISVVVVDGLMGLGSVIGWWLFVVVVVAGGDLGFCLYLDFGIYYFNE